MTEENSATSGAFESRLYCLHALTPLHVGTGRGTGFIDLPIAREIVSGWPFIPGSAIKGVVADHHAASRDRDRDPGHDEVKGDPEAVRRAQLNRLAFGRAGDEASNAGCLVFTDAHLVCLPVRSLYGTFAWCTCPIALERLRRDLKAARLDDGLPVITAEASADVLPIQTPDDPASVLVERGKVYLEDLDFTAMPSPSTARWAGALAAWAFPDTVWQRMFRQRFVMVPDDVFNFLCQTATQVDARVKIDDQTKTVADGQLWYEESLPTETVLAGIVWCGPLFGGAGSNDRVTRAQVLETFAERPSHLQIGGKATVGRGRVEMSFAAPAPRADR